LKASKLVIEYEFDFGLIAIASAVKEFKLAWHLNQSLGLQLVKQQDEDLIFTKNRRILISNFLFETEYVSFRLLKNKAVESEGIPKPYLVAELKQYDFLLKIEGENFELEIEKAFLNLKKIPVIQLVEKVSPNILQSKENLLF